MKIFTMSKSYCVSMTLAQFARMEMIDDLDENKGCYLHTLIEKDPFPNGQQISKIEFNGHFGKNFFFTIDLGHKTIAPETGRGLSIEGLYDEAAFEVKKRLEAILRTSMKQLRHEAPKPRPVK